MQEYVLITAGGAGNRLGSDLPKQFLNLKGRPVLMHVFDAFMTFSEDLRFVLVLPDAYHDSWKKLCGDHELTLPHQVVSGGPTRFHSVKSGLRHIPDESLVAIHDGVRPLVSAGTIASGFHYAKKFGNAIPVIETKEAMRMMNGPISAPLPSERIRTVQTPQCFKASLIKKAYQQNYHESFTDDASVLESEGERLFLIDGNPENIKITIPADLIMAGALLST